MTGKQIVETAAARVARAILADEATYEDAEAIEREFAPFAELVEAVQYPRHANVAQLLLKAADVLNLDAEKAGMQSYITPHMKRAADGIIAALAAVEKIGEGR